MATKPVLGYWNIRGLAHSIRMLLHYLGVDFENKLYEFGPAPDFSNASWLADKFNLGLDFPNVPYWIEGDVKVTESRAILRYVANTRGPELCPKTAEEDALAMMVDGVMSDIQNALVAVAYSKTGVPEEPLETALAPKFKQVEAFFEKNKFVLGERICYIDFRVYEVLKEFTRYNPEFLKPYPALAKYVLEIESFPQLTEFIKASDALKCYGAYATLQF